MNEFLTLLFENKLYSMIFFLPLAWIILSTIIKSILRQKQKKEMLRTLSESDKQVQKLFKKLDVNRETLLKSFTDINDALVNTPVDPFGPPMSPPENPDDPLSKDT